MHRIHNHVALFSVCIALFACFVLADGTESAGGVRPADVMSVDDVVVDRWRRLQNRARDFAERCRAKGDVESRMFAEQSAADAEELERMLREKAAYRATSPVRTKDPARLNVKDFGAKGDGRADDSAAFARACEAVRALRGRPCVLRIPAGTYRLATSRTLKPVKTWSGMDCGDPWVLHGYCVFDSLDNCLIEGDGPTNTFLRAGLHDRQFMLLNCRNCTVRGVELALERIPYLEGRLETWDAATASGIVRLVPGSLAPDDESWQLGGFAKSSECFGALFDARGLFIQNAAFLNWGPDRRCEKLPDGRWRLAFNRISYRWCLNAVRAGHSIVIPNRTNSFGAMHIFYCHHCTVEDVWVRTSRSSAFYGIRSRGTVYHRCRDFPPEGHLLASNADACFTDPGSFVYRCRFDSMCDDGFNVRTYADRLERTARQDEVVRRDFGPANPGDLALFADPWTGANLGLGRVVEDSAPFFRPGDGWYRTTRFAAPVPEKAVKGTFLYFPRQHGVGTVVSDCSFRNGRLSGLVLQSPCLLVEDCTFEHIGASGIRLGALGDYKEGPPPYNALIRGCHVTDCRTGITSWIRMCDETKTRWSKELASPIRGIDLIGNRFDSTVATPVSMKNATEVNEMVLPQK